MPILKTIQLRLPRVPCSQEAVEEQILYPQCIHNIEQTGATVDLIFSTLMGRMSANITIPDIPHLCFSYYKDKKTVVQREQTSFVFFLLLLETNCGLFFQGHSLFIENYYKEVEGTFSYLLGSDSISKRTLGANPFPVTMEQEISNKQNIDIFNIEEFPSFLCVS